MRKATELESWSTELILGDWEEGLNRLGSLGILISAFCFPYAVKLEIS